MKNRLLRRVKRTLLTVSSSTIFYSVVNVRADATVPVFTVTVVSIERGMPELQKTTVDNSKQAPLRTQPESSTRPQKYTRTGGGSTCLLCPTDRFIQTPSTLPHPPHKPSLYQYVEFALNGLFATVFNHHSYVFYRHTTVSSNELKYLR